MRLCVNENIYVSVAGIFGLGQFLSVISHLFVIICSLLSFVIVLCVCKVMWFHLKAKCSGFGGKSAGSAVLSE